MLPPAGLRWARAGAGREQSRDVPPTQGLAGSLGTGCLLQPGRERARVSVFRENAAAGAVQGKGRPAKQGRRLSERENNRSATRAPVKRRPFPIAEQPRLSAAWQIGYFHSSEPFGTVQVYCRIYGNTDYRLLLRLKSHLSQMHQSITSVLEANNE